MGTVDDVILRNIHILLRNIWPSIAKMSIKVISLILIAFLARNCYKYIINYKSVDFDNNYITPMFMRKVGVGKKILSKNFWLEKIYRPRTLGCQKKTARKSLCVSSQVIFFLRNSRDVIWFSDSSKKLNIFPFGHRKWQQLKDEVL